jgi:signal transduction histidine kinase
VEFLGYAAGELRAQLLGILNLLGRARGAGEWAEERETLLLDALLAGKHMAELLRDLAELARPGSSGLPMEVRPTDLGALFRELRDPVEAFPRRGGGELGWPELPELPEVLADRGALGQILLSLIAGALRSSLDGSLRIWVEREPMSLSLCLLLPSLHFGERAGASRRILRPEDCYIQGQNGAGLCLVICGQLMDAMGGALVIHPVAPEEGTVIGLELVLA